MNPLPLYDMVSDEYAERWISPEFRAKVKAELDEAEDRVTEYLEFLASTGIKLENTEKRINRIKRATPNFTPRRPYKKRSKKQVNPTATRTGKEFKRKKTCISCGCALDELNEDCRNCRARHIMRAKSKADAKQWSDRIEGK